MQGLTGYVDELNSRVKQATGRVKQATGRTSTRHVSPCSGLIKGLHPGTPHCLHRPHPGLEHREQMRFFTLLGTSGNSFDHLSGSSPPSFSSCPHSGAQPVWAWLSGRLYLQYSTRPGSIRWVVTHHSEPPGEPGVFKEWEPEHIGTEEDSGDIQPWGRVSTQRRKPCFPMRLGL